jgi:PAS domain S-box-containing protein
MNHEAVAGALRRAILDNERFSGIATDESGVIQIFDAGAERMLGYKAADVINKLALADICDPQEAAARAESLSRELGIAIKPGFEALVFKASRGIPDVYPLTCVHKDGGRFPAILSVSALRGERDGIIGYLLATSVAARTAANPASTPPEPAAAGPRTRTLLYVEDKPANLALVEQLIARRPDIRLLSAANGALGIELARAHLPDAILMDIALPGISGFEAMQSLRNDPLTAHIPILALSAHGTSADIKRGLEAGFFLYITKPIKVHEFMDALDVALERSKKTA